MPFKHFTIPVSHGEAGEQELNSFLSRHRVVSVEQRWHQRGDLAMWCYCVEYLVAAASTSDSPEARKAATKGKIDYREVLSPEQFAVYSKLRDVRQQLAQAEGCPIYVVFTNEQLARMVRERIATKEGMASITGVGDARKERFGSRMLELLAVEYGAPASSPARLPR